MGKSLKEYLTKEKVMDKGNLNVRIRKDLLDKVESYKKEVDVTWTELLEAFFQKLIDDEMKGKQK